MEGADSSWNRHCEAESADEGEEKGIDKIQMVKEGSRPHSAGRHEPVGHPDECRIGEKHPFALHLQAAGKALKYASENAEDLAAELIGIPESPQCITARSRCCHHDRHDPPYIEIKP